MTALLPRAIAMLLATSWVTVCWAQQQQTVQLPTFSFSTVNTTVTVPDGGSALLGGVKRAATGSVERGVPLLGKVPVVNRLFRNRGIGQQRSSSMMHTTVQIIILEELEKEVMERAYASRAARGDRRTFEELVAEDRAAVLQRHLAAERLRADKWRAALLARQAKPAAEERTAALAAELEALRRQNELAARQRMAEAKVLLEKAEAAEAAGHDGAARVYYQMAAKRATGTLKELAEGRWQSLQKGSKVAETAHREP